MSEKQSDEVVVRVLRLKQVQERLGLGRSTIYDRLNKRSPRFDSTFPKPIRLSNSPAGRGGRVGWLESAICRWIEECAAAGRAVPSPVEGGMPQ
ncbi:AlpA family phage regulatory protein [Pseudomonas sp. SL4(2022)]|uniref:helix-turn-helix transcriptional regulator n=1 Tax=Pseudomonas sp. SL4(2022) TaxID=2994661 RepID=UPI00226DA89B|nr:AlpA family phage regulatory protein [Pseudomonas sp. SL4(2022)]WAC45398.1 AlpA family phage regulatory protein [Pseudomonas sp. SL4(2022)]